MFYNVNQNDSVIWDKLSLCIWWHLKEIFDYEMLDFDNILKSIPIKSITTKSYYWAICRSPDQTGEFGKRPFLSWVRALGSIAETPSGCKNTSGPVGIPLKRGASGPRQ